MLKVLQLLTMPVGGIRKHVESILLDDSKGNLEYFCIYSNLVSDAQFTKNKSLIDKSIKASLALPIRKIPWPTDILNIVNIARFVKRYKIDVIHCHGAKAGILGRVVGGLTSTKTFCTPHGGSLHANRSMLMTRFYLIVEHLMVKWTTFFVFESEYSLRAFEGKVAMTDNKIINYNGVRCEDYVEPRKFTQKVGFIGELRIEKGPDVFVETIEKYNRVFEKKIEGHIFGSGPLQEDLETKIASQNISITLHGNVPTVADELKKLDILVVPSRFESLGYVILEALNSGVIVVCSGVGGTSEVISDGYNGLICRDNSAERYAYLIDKIINSSDDIINKYRQNGLLTLQDKFCETKMLMTLKRQYSSVI